MLPLTMSGYYDENGTWVKTKECLVYCGMQCNCQPPEGIYQLEGEALKQHQELLATHEDR